jgi:pilus assembly protein Flp/PilA
MAGAIQAPIITLRNALRRVRVRDDAGQGLAEYGLILGLVAIVCIVAVTFLSGSIQGILSNLGSSI